MSISAAYQRSITDRYSARNDPYLRVGKKTRWIRRRSTCFQPRFRRIDISPWNDLDGWGGPRSFDKSGEIGEGNVRARDPTPLPTLSRVIR